MNNIKNKNNNKENPSLNKQTIIGDYALDYAGMLLIGNDREVKLEPLTYAFLCFLIKRKGQIVSRDELLNNVWENRIVSDDSIRKVVKRLRDAFEDDAKSPFYIKTIPLKGYCLIAQVNENQITKKENTSRNLKWLILIFSILILVIYITVFMTKKTLPSNNPIKDHSPKIQHLTHLSGSEVSGDYNKAIDTLIFTHRQNNNDSWQLYSKELSSGLVKRLTWDEKNYQKALIAPNGEQIIFSRSYGVETNLILAKFDKKHGIIEEKKINIADKIQLLSSWAVDGKSVYVTHSEKEDEPLALYKVNINSEKSQQLTFPNEEGFGDYYAKESSNGRYLAVLRNVSDRKYMLLILDLVNNKLLTKKAISFYANSILWEENNKGLSMSSFKGDFYNFQLENEQLIKQQGSTPGINDAFYRCGEKCFFMRQHQMNYTDIKETPNPFTNNDRSPTLYIESDNADFHPIYNDKADTIFYIAKDKKQANIIKHILGQPPEILYSFDPRFIITDLSLNKQENMLLGKVEERIFLLNLITNELFYVSTALEIVSNPTWKNSGDGIYFSRVELHKETLLEYDISLDSLKKHTPGIIYRKELSDGRTFIVNEKKDLFQLMPDGSRLFIINLPIPNNRYWTIYQNYLYFSHGLDDNFYLSQLNLTSGQQKEHLMGENTWEMGFDLHPNGKKLLITQALLADSNLVKVTW